jgi:uncharacterized RDD family membrane protein YckC
VNAPPSTIPREARPFQGRRAGLATRVLASTLDGVILAALLGCSYLVWAAVIFLWNPAGFHLPAPSRPFLVVAYYLFATAYLTLGWWISGRTFGDEVIGLRVANRRGGPLRLTTALARAAFCVLFPPGLLWTAFSRENRSLADLLLRTSVVYDWRTAPSRAPASGLGAATGSEPHEVPATGAVPRSAW